MTSLELKIFPELESRAGDFYIFSGTKASETSKPTLQGNEFSEYFFWKTDSQRCIKDMA